jgi:hypothetical protein
MADSDVDSDVTQAQIHPLLCVSAQPRNRRKIALFDDLSRIMVIAFFSSGGTAGPNAAISTPQICHCHGQRSHP